ncbi:MAG: VOC family protein [Anaerolineae bacterium]
MFDLKFNHIGITAPVGAEDQARSFYCDILGFVEIEKPDSLKPNGGLWLQTGNLPLHIGVENRPEWGKTKRHPAFETADLEKLRDHLQKCEIEIVQATPIPGYVRFYIYDPFGNRIECMQNLT